MLVFLLLSVNLSVNLDKSSFSPTTYLVVGSVSFSIDTVFSILNTPSLTTNASVSANVVLSL